jgi:hypothetical protein
MIPTTASTLGELYASEWMDLGNGIISQAANNVLGVMINIPQAATTYNPTFAMTSGQWEAASTSFKASSGAQMIQQKSATAAAASVAATPALTTGIGNTIIVIVRTTNPSGGAPTITITDAGSNSYTNDTKVTNSSDGTYGSTLQISKCIGATAATGAVTATCTGTSPTQMKILVLEYQGILSVDAANVNATGNSAAPASGNITTTVAGDLIIGAAANAGSSNALTAATGFELRSSLSDANGSIAAVDSLATQALSTGAINIICCGTEE